MLTCRSRHRVARRGFFCQVRIFLRWVRFIVVHAVWDRQHVFVNMDETQLASVKHRGEGMISGRRRKRTDSRRAPRDRVDRHHTKVTYIAVVSDSAQLQPLLPQVILPRYTQHARPPPHLLNTYAEFGHPFEFWHGTKGATTPGLVQTWLTRLRSVISSFSDRAWIILLLDCDTSHLSVLTMAHIRRLGIIPLLVPAKLTWLLQLLDVYVFGTIKKDMRYEELKSREASDTGVISNRERIKYATSSIRRMVINRDWTSSFNKLGYGSAHRPTASQLLQYVDDGDVEPALPTLAEFAELISRPAHTDVTQRLHRMCIRAAIDLAKADPHATPAVGAQVDLPPNDNAMAVVSIVQRQHQDADDVLQQFLEQQDHDPPSLTGHTPARNVFMDNNGREVV